MTTLPPNTTSAIRPQTVEFRQPCGPGVRVVVVVFSGNQPRIQARTETFRAELEIMPMFLTLSETFFYTAVAALKLGLSPTSIVLDGADIASIIKSAEASVEGESK